MEEGDSLARAVRMLDEEICYQRNILGKDVTCEAVKEDILRRLRERGVSEHYVTVLSGWWEMFFETGKKGRRDNKFDWRELEV